MTQAKRPCFGGLLLFGILLLGGHIPVYSEEPFDQNRMLETLSSESHDGESNAQSKNISEPPQNIPLDSTHQKFVNAINARYHKAPVHPRFRDQYRVLQDIRRLFRMVDRRSINGYEPIDQLAEIGQQLPIEKQRLMIGAAAAGGVASVAAGYANQQLRKQKINYLRWNVERVFARFNIKKVNLQLYSGLDERGFHVSLPKYQLSYTQYAENKSMGEHITYFPFKHVGVQAGYYNERQVITPILRFRYGALMCRYERDLHILISRIESRYYSHFVMRLLYVSFYNRPQSNYWRGEMIMYW
ncbi:hypothetical protein JW960_19170 [candidate division KSB1 bacterium]|nr:hypothetical protein [candidate division KSB1 bacterium]